MRISGLRRRPRVRLIAGTVTTTVPSAHTLMNWPTTPSLVPIPSAIAGSSPAGMVSALTRMKPISASRTSARHGIAVGCVVGMGGAVAGAAECMSSFWSAGDDVTWASGSTDQV